MPGKGPAIFGPVIHTVPSDDDAVEMFRHVSWLVRQPSFWEIKRERTESPDLEHATRSSRPTRRGSCGRSYFPERSGARSDE